LVIHPNDTINYKEFLAIFQHHEKPQGNSLKDKHRFHEIHNGDGRCESVVSNVSSIEAKLIHMFHNDYVQLLNKFK